MARSGVGIMHLYTISRGQKDKIDQFFRDLEAQFLPYMHDAHAKNPSMLQFGVRPIYIHELAFPKEHLDVVLRTIQPVSFDEKAKLTNLRGVMKRIVWILKKALKLKPIPTWEPKGPAMAVRNRPIIDVRGIGLKEDKVKEIELI